MTFVHHTCYCIPKTIQTPDINIYAPLTGTVASPLNEIELSESNSIILVYAIFIRVLSISKCLYAK